MYISSCPKVKVSALVLSFGIKCIFVYLTAPNKPTELSGVRLINNRVKLFWNDQQSSVSLILVNS